MSLYTDRVVVLVDMDCFYCQVEEKLDQKLSGKPIAVVQYNQWRGGGIIAVNYPARDRGVTRHMRGNEAKEKCPEIELVRVPNVRGKADITKYREAGKRVAEVLQTFTPLLERASVDEAYLDLTDSVNKRMASILDKITIDSLNNTYVVGCETKDFLHNVYNNELQNESNLKLIIGGTIVEDIRKAVYEKTGYRCSAGIAHNKILSKLACGLHKPNKQTILPQDSVKELYKSLPIKKIKSLGGKFGNSLSEDLGITNMGELINFTERELAKKYDHKIASWLYNIARGIDVEPVQVRLVSKSIGCCKKFPGKTALKTVEDVTHWLSELATEIAERLEQDVDENNRRAKQIVLNIAQPVNRKDVQTSKSQPLNSYEGEKIAHDAFETLKKMAQKADGSFHLTFLGLSVGKFEDIKNVSDISTFFKKINGHVENEADSLSARKIEDIITTTTTTTSTYNKSNISNFFKIVPKVNGRVEPPNYKKTEYLNGALNLDDIEEDAQNDSEINLNETLKDIEHMQTFLQEDNDYSNTTIELDLTEQLKTKEEFPYFSTIFHDTSKSFFIKYVTNKENCKSKSISPPNFIDQETAGCSYEYVSPNPNSVQDKNENLFLENSNSSSMFDEIESTCPECNKKVHHLDYVAHMDHHLAQKLMAEEREIFKAEFQAKKQSIGTKVTKGGKVNKSKRKSDETNSTINSFFCKETDKEINADDTELCPECDKRIPLNEYACHLDYHAAKKLHLELNSMSNSNNNNTRKSAVNNKTKGSCKKTNGIVSISNFFKSVEN